MKTTTPNNLRKYREALELRQRDVANMLGFASEDRISHWEKGTAVPNIVNLFRLSRLYKVPAEVLYPELVKTIEKEITWRQEKYMQMQQAPTVSFSPAQNG